MTLYNSYRNKFRRLVFLDYIKNQISNYKLGYSYLSSMFVYDYDSNKLDLSSRYRISSQSLYHAFWELKYDFNFDKFKKIFDDLDQKYVEELYKISNWSGPKFDDYLELEKERNHIRNLASYWFCRWKYNYNDQTKTQVELQMDRRSYKYEIKQLNRSLEDLDKKYKLLIQKYYTLITSN